MRCPKILDTVSDYLGIKYSEILKKFENEANTEIRKKLN